MLAGDATSAVAQVALESTELATDLVVVSSDLGDSLSELLREIGENAEIVLLDPSAQQPFQDGLDQLDQVIRSKRNLRSLHLITHGASGKIQLGNQPVSADDFAPLTHWKDSFTETADVLLYGCSIAEGGRGAHLMQVLSEISGADVAASSDATGHSDRGGDWDMERKLGTIEAPLIVAADVRDRFQGLLPITISAAGTTNTEIIELQIDGSIVATFENIGGSAYGGVTEDYTYDVDGVSPDRIRVAFINDLVDPVTGEDRNVRIDKVTVDSVVLQTESPLVFSTGTYLPSDGVVPGFRQNEFLHANGYFQYASEDPGSQIRIRARGDEGQESMTLAIDGQPVQSWTNVGQDWNEYVFVSDRPVLSSQVQIRFTNDFTDQTEGIDRNLQVDWIEIDGQRTEVESPDTYSTGTWLAADGITPGFRQNEYLHANGEFRFSQLSEPASTLTVYARGEDGTEGFALQIDGITVMEYDSIGDDFSAFIYTSEASITADQVRIVFDSDRWDPALNIDSNLIVDRIEINDEIHQTEAIEVFSTGSWRPEDGIQEGYRRSEALNVNGYFQFASNTAPTGIFQYDQHLYRLTTQPLSWTQAQAQAESLGGNLVTVNSAEEHAWLSSVFGNERLWIGLNDVNTEGEFVWASGEPVTYTNWADGRPNDLGDEDFVEMNFDPVSANWNDVDESGVRFGIIEIGSSVNDSPLTPNGSGFETTTIASGLVQPISFDLADDGRIFVAEKEGRVQVVENGAVVDTFLDINLEVNSHHDRGLLGIALDPDFVDNGYVYIQYAVELDPTNPDAPDFNSPAGGRLVRYTASSSNPNVADLSSRLVIQDGHQMSHATHAVGDIDFDNDGNLIFTWGDGGFDNDLRLAAQDPNSAQGKLFRIDPVTFQGVSDNPFYDATDPSSTASRVWALGIRNSWKLTVDRATGDVYMGEVTDEGPEEINVMRAIGATTHNFGWPYYEGNLRTSYGTVPEGFVYDQAFVSLPHTNAGGGDSIIGGAVFRGNQYPDTYDSRYFFGNFNQGMLYTADQGGNYQAFGEAGDYPGIVDIQLGPDGTLWLMSIFSGEIQSLRYETQGVGNTDPNAIAIASATAGIDSLTVSFDASASTDDDGDPLLFAWDFDSDGTIDRLGENVAFTFETLGRTTTTLLVSDGRGGTETATFEIDVLDASSSDPNNLALGKQTAQSGVVDGGISSRAVDGNSDPDFSNGSVTQTLQTRTPLWEVDLGESFNIDRVEIVTRQDGIAPLENFWVLISDNPFSSGNLDAARNALGVTAIEVTGAANPLEIIATNALGRFVRIQMAGVNDVLSLVEVRVLEA